MYMKSLWLSCAATVGLLISTASAGWIAAPMTNPGAETGDLTGWSTYDNRFIAVSNATEAYEGDAYFFSEAARSTSNGVSFNQTVDLSAYTGSIINVDISAAFQYETGQRWGYDADTDTNYLYNWDGTLIVNARNGNNGLFGIGFGLASSDTWDTTTISCNLRSDWETKRETLTCVNVTGQVMYMPVESGSPGSYNIESWGEWVGTQPTFVGFDAFCVSVEIVPEPGTLSLVVLGALALLHRRRRP